MNVIEIETDEKDFEDELNEMYGTVEICGMTFDQGTALKELDPTAFRCALADKDIRYACGECSAEFDDKEEAEACCTPVCRDCGSSDKPLHTDERCPDCHAEVRP